MICKILIDIHGKVCFHQKDDLLHYFLTNHRHVPRPCCRDIEFVRLSPCQFMSKAISLSRPYRFIQPHSQIYNTCHRHRLFGCAMSPPHGSCTVLNYSHLFRKSASQALLQYISSLKKSKQMYCAFHILQSIKYLQTYSGNTQ